MNASEARLIAARIWLMAAESAGITVTVVGEHVYCGKYPLDLKVKVLLGTLQEHKPALVAIFSDEDNESRFQKARAMYPGPEKIEGE